MLEVFQINKSASTIFRDGQEIIVGIRLAFYGRCNYEIREEFLRLFNSPPFPAVDFPIPLEVYLPTISVEVLEGHLGIVCLHFQPLEYSEEYFNFSVTVNTLPKIGE